MLRSISRSQTTILTMMDVHSDFRRCVAEEAELELAPSMEVERFVDDNGNYASQGNRLGVPYLLGCLAELEAAAGDAERALALIDEGLAMADEGGQQVCDAFLHRLRGDILHKRDLTKTAPAEEAYQSIAKRQGARSYELLASLSLAKLYQSTARPVDAHAVLAPAVEGFSPTQEMPEIAEARALLGELSKPSS